MQIRHKFFLSPGKALRAFFLLWVLTTCAASAVMVGNPVVNIQEVPGKYPKQHYNVQTASVSSGTNGEENELGSIGTVFGGGNEAEVIGSTTVNVATEADKGAYILGNVYGGGNAADVTGKTNVAVGH